MAVRLEDFRPPNVRRIAVPGGTLDVQLRIAPYGTIPYGVYLRAQTGFHDVVQRLNADAVADAAERAKTLGKTLEQVVEAALAKLQPEGKADGQRALEAQHLAIAELGASRVKELFAAQREFQRTLVRWGIEPDIGLTDTENRPLPLETGCAEFDGLKYEVLADSGLAFLDSCLVIEEKGKSLLARIAEEISNALVISDDNKKKSGF